MNSLEIHGKPDSYLIRFTKNPNLICILIERNNLLIAGIKQFESVVNSLDLTFCRYTRTLTDNRSQCHV